MSAPSTSHKERVQVLRSIATLAGFDRDVAIGAGLIPDVARLCLASGGLFIGDAKATETSGCAATAERLEAYVRAIRPTDRDPHASSLLMVLAHEARAADDWLSALIRVLRQAGMATPQRVGSSVLDADCTLTYISSQFAGGARPAGSTNCSSL
jgi:hypothetical protein